MPLGFRRCIEGGGIVVFPAETVYGLACDPENEEAYAKLNLLKGRSQDKPSAIMFFQVEPALEFVADLDKSVVEVARKLLPGPVTLILSNPGRRYFLACGSNANKIGLRVPSMGEASRLFEGFDGPILQTSANFSGEPAPGNLDEVPDGILDQVDLAFDGGVLPGTPSTVIDLVRFGPEGTYRIMREGALPAAEVDRALSASD